MESTTIRVYKETVEQMRIAATELAASRRLYLATDDERLNALVDHYNITKSLAPAAQDSAGVLTPSPRQG